MIATRLAFSLPFALVAVAAQAGDEVIYAPAPDWVERTDLTEREEEAATQFVRLDQQARIEDGQLWNFRSTAIKLDSPQALTRFGTLSAQWLPDKGDLIVHSVSLIRDGERIDLLADGAQFEVLRREKGLESRLLDGSLTATMAVPGARLGDIVHLSFSVTLNDQAMGDNVQWQSPLVAKPFPLEAGRTSVSWPEALSVTRARTGEAAIGEPVLSDGYYTWSVDMPIEEIDETPKDAPARFKMGERMQVSTYSDWAHVSRQMAQHYSVAGAITPGGELEKTIAAIAAKSDDPLTRAALAVQQVQDDVSYLLNGLNGGNYLPQSPEETWEKRYGDCKAKSLLLLAMLRELGVEAEVVLVRSKGGDALPQLAPMPGNFDHMIVRAQIEGTNYWLDGTSTGTRASNIARVPRFFHALPLRDDGAELMALDTRSPNVPDRIVRLTIDQSAGIRVPALLDIEIEFSGPAAAAWRSVSEQGDIDVRQKAIARGISRVLGSLQTLDEEVEFNAQTGVAILRARGLQTSKWRSDRTVYEMVPPVQAAKNVGFRADRARAAWRDIPLRLNGPLFSRSEITIQLPEEAEPFEIKGKEEAEGIIGGVDLKSRGLLDGNTFTLTQRMRSLDEELPADQIPTARRALARFDRALPVVRSPENVRQTWDYFGDDRARLAQLEAFYAQSIEEADEDEPASLLNRANFLNGVHDYAAALADAEAALEVEASQRTYRLLGSLRWETGDLEGALEEFRMAEDLKPDGSTYYSQVGLLSLLGRHEEAIELAIEYGDIVDNPVREADLHAAALAWSGSIQEGMELLEDLNASRPGDGKALNELCWYAGIWDQMDEDRFAICTQAVEKSDYSLNALDSRAMAHFRLGRLEEARADLDAVMLAQPSMTASRLLRGLVRVAQGDKGGREEIELALAIKPSLRANYEAWGFEF